MYCEPSAPPRRPSGSRSASSLAASAFPVPSIPRLGASAASFTLGLLGRARRGDIRPARSQPLQRAQRVVQLEVLDALLLELGGREVEPRVLREIIFLEQLVVDLGLAEQVTAKIRLTHHLAVLEVRIGELRNGNVRVDAAGLNRAARRRVIARRGQPESRLRTHDLHRLDRALAEAAFAQNERAMVVLQGSSDDLRRGGAAGVDQDDDRKAMGHVARSRIIALDVVLRPAALRDDLAALEEGVTDVDGLVEQAAGVGAQVDDVAERLSAGRLVDRQQRRLCGVTRVSGERVDVDDANAVLDLPLHRAKLDPFADDRDVERLVTPGADNAQLDVRSGRALHLLDRLVEAQAVEQFAVDVGDIVAGLDPGPPCRRVLHRRDDFYRAILDADRDPEAAVIAVGR